MVIYGDNSSDDGGDDRGDDSGGDSAVADDISGEDRDVADT